MKLTLIPYGGLANRMKAIDSLIRMTSEINSDIETGVFEDSNVEAHNISSRNDNVFESYIVWFENNHLNCPFERIFEPISVPYISIRNANITDYLINDRPRKKNLFAPSLFQKVIYNASIHENDVTIKAKSGFDFKEWAITNKKTILSSCVRFYDHDYTSNYSNFRPTEELRKRIDEICSIFSSRTIGIHIRRTDHNISISKSPTSLFIDRMKQEILLDNNVRFYLASDSQEVKKELLDEFGDDRIITSNKLVTRNTSEGIEDAVVELYVLSRTNKIIGSFGSTYSYLAAEIGGIALEIIESK